MVTFIILMCATCLQEDKPWEWTKLFAEVSGDITKVWNKLTQNVASKSTSTVPTEAATLYLPGKATF